MAQRHKKPRLDHTRRRPAATITWRAVLSACLLVLFGLQGIVAQGHSHVRNGAGVSVVAFGDVVIAKSDDSSRGGTVPRGDDSSNCGLCQSVSGAAAPLALAIVLLLPVPETAAEPAYLRAPVVDVGAVSFAWTPRGPPELSPLHV
jgi:hypothetical protein